MYWLDRFINRSVTIALYINNLAIIDIWYSTNGNDSETNIFFQRYDYYKRFDYTADCSKLKRLVIEKDNYFKDFNFTNFDQNIRAVRVTIKTENQIFGLADSGAYCRYNNGVKEIVKKVVGCNISTWYKCGPLIYHEMVVEGIKIFKLNLPLVSGQSIGGTYIVSGTGYKKVTHCQYQMISTYFDIDRTYGTNHVKKLAEELYGYGNCLAKKI